MHFRVTLTGMRIYHLPDARRQGIQKPAHAYDRRVRGDTATLIRPEHSNGELK